MLRVKSLIIGITGSVGIGGTLLGSSYHTSKKTIWDEVKEDVLDVNYKNTFIKEWTELHQLLKSESNEKINENAKLAEIKTKSDSTHDSLREWCKEEYSKTYSSIFWEDKSSTKDLVHKYCTFTIAKKLGNDKIFTNSDQEAIKAKIKQINADKDSKQDFQLEKDISDVQENDWNKLLLWCESKYKNGYQGQNQNKWKLVDKYCKKD